MSTRYTFVNSEKKEDAEKLAKILTGIRDHCDAELAKAESEAPLMEEVIEDIQLRLRQAIQNCEPWYKDDKDDIGTYHVQGFSWASHNGFRSLSDIQAFLDSHPDWHIEDEYGTAVSLENFEKLVSGKTYAVRLPSSAAVK